MSDTRKSVNALRKQGCVVIVWEPEDVWGMRESWSLKRCQEELAALRTDLEDRSVERGWEVLEILLPAEDSKAESSVST